LGSPGQPEWHSDAFSKRHHRIGQGKKVFTSNAGPATGQDCISEVRRENMSYVDAAGSDNAAVRWRERSEAIRTLADVAMDADVRAMMQRMAADYDRFAGGLSGAAESSAATTPESSDR
jgi:hypothetical protein